MGFFGLRKNGKENEFYSLLVKHAKLVYEAYQLLPEYLEKQDKNLADKIFKCEHEADDMRRILIDELNKTLITPIDREDLFAISRGIDDVVDAAKSTVEELNVFRVSATPMLITMAKILEKATLELQDALKNLREHPNIAKEHAVKAKTAENHMHHIYLQALAELFDKEDKSAGYMLKMRELYRHLNRSADRCDEAANTILNIIVKLE